MKHGAFRHKSEVHSLPLPASACIHAFYCMPVRAEQLFVQHFSRRRRALPGSWLPRQHLNLWGGSFLAIGLDLWTGKLFGNQVGSSTKPPKSQQLFVGGSRQQPSGSLLSGPSHSHRESSRQGLDFVEVRAATSGRAGEFEEG